MIYNIINIFSVFCIFCVCICLSMRILGIKNKLLFILEQIMKYACCIIVVCLLCLMIINSINNVKNDVYNINSEYKINFSVTKLKLLTKTYTFENNKLYAITVKNTHTNCALDCDCHKDVSAITKISGNVLNNNKTIVLNIKNCCWFTTDKQQEIKDLETRFNENDITVYKLFSFNITEIK